MRFIILALPYLYIITSYSLFHIYDKIKRKNILNNFFLVIVFLIFILQFFSLIFALESNDIQQENKYSYFQNYLENKEIKGNIWITNPKFSVFFKQEN